jgi:hypothetical protein
VGQITNFKSQIPNNVQTQNSNFQTVCNLEPGAWNLFVIWYLSFGACYIVGAYLYFGACDLVLVS